MAESIAWGFKQCFLNESTGETGIITSAPVSIIQLFRFSNQGVQLVKDGNFFSCTQAESIKHLTVHITIEDQVSFANRYYLSAPIDHPNALNRGHYWDLSITYTRLLGTLAMASWFFNVDDNFLNNTTSYIPFTVKFKFFPGFSKNLRNFARGFCHFRHCLWVWQPYI